MPSAEFGPDRGESDKDRSTEMNQHDVYWEEVSPQRLDEVARDFIAGQRQVLAYYESLERTPLREELIEALRELIGEAAAK